MVTVTRKKADLSLFGGPPDAGLELQALYGRTSTDEQKKDQTIESQMLKLRQMGQVLEWNIVDEYLDPGVSGTVPFAERPAGARLLQDARAGRVTQVVFYSIDRLGRSLKAIMDAYELLEALGVSIKSATQQFDTSTTAGKFFFQMLSIVAELERNNIRERFQNGRERKAEDGKWIAGPIPYGYMVDDRGWLVPSTHAPDGTPLVDWETEAEVVRAIFAYVADGHSATEAASWLNGIGVKFTRRYTNGNTRKNGVAKRWYTSIICDMLRSDLYARGRHEFHLGSGGAVTRKKRRLGLPTENLPQRTVVRTYPPLVTVAVQEQALATLTGNRARVQALRGDETLLAGVLRCTCGHSFVRVSSHHLVRGRLYEYTQYRCSATLKKLGYLPARCNAKLLPADWLDGLVWRMCQSIADQPEAFLADVQAELRQRQETTPDRHEEQATLEHQIADIVTAIEREKDLYRERLQTMEETRKRCHGYEGQITQLQQHLKEIAIDRSLANIDAGQHEQALAMLAQVRQRMTQIDAEGLTALKRAVILHLVKQITVETTGERRQKKVRIQAHVYLRPGRPVPLEDGRSRTTDQYAVEYANGVQDDIPLLETVVTLLAA